MPLQLRDDCCSAFEGYVSRAITKFGVPGAAVAVMGLEVRYLRGFGVKKPDAKAVGARAFTFAVQFHLFELVFDQPAEIDAELAALVQTRSASQPQLSPSIDPAAVEPYLAFPHRVTRRIPFIGVDQTVCGGPQHWLDIGLPDLAATCQAMRRSR
jgi:hypothetical protein